MCEDTPLATMRLSKSVKAPALAREFVRQNACWFHSTSAEGALELLASELVTNAVLHGSPPIWLSIECSVHVLRVAVHDGDGTKPARPTPDGLGLMIVDKVSHDWGTDLTLAGKTVWCRLPTGFIPAQRSPTWQSGAHPRPRLA